MAFDRRSVAIVLVLLLAAGALGVAAGALLGGGRTSGGQARPASATDPGGAPSSSIDARQGAPKIPAPLPTGPPVPVYVLGSTEAGARLYREFRAGGAAAAADPVRAALAALGEPPADPDYRTPWAGVPATATRAGADVTVTFAAAPRLGAAGEAGLAVQQVVHTVTAADTAVKRVRVVAPGLPAALSSAPVGRAGQLDVLAPVWLLTPVDGGTAGRTVTLSGTASVFEATVSVEARRGADVVARAVATASTGAPGRGEWTATVTLRPGDYVLAAYEVSAKDGSRLAVDTKRVTVD